MILFVITWSFDDQNDIMESRLVKSFLNYNEKDKLHHLHFNRNKYINLESEFESRFGYQYEFLLYRILDVNIKDLNTKKIGQHFVGDKNKLKDEDFLNSIEFIDKSELPYKVKEYGTIVTVSVNFSDIDLYETIRTKGNYLNECEYTVRNMNYVIKNVEKVKLR